MQSTGQTSTHAVSHVPTQGSVIMYVIISLIIRSFNPMFKQKNLNFFLLSVPLMNSIARAIYDVAFIWLVLELTNSERITGLVAMTSYLPAILCGLFIGAIVDLFSKTRMISFATIMQGLILTLIPILFFFNIKSVWVIVLIAFLQKVNKTQKTPSLKISAQFEFFRDFMPFFGKIGKSLEIGKSRNSNQRL